MLDHKIKTFLTLCETMNYRLAAEKLHITQPAVTQQIQALEEHYQCRLFEYNARQLKKTVQGELLENVSRSMFYQEKRLHDAIRQSTLQKVSIGLSKTIGEVVIAEHLARFLRHSEYTAEVFVANTEQLLEQLDRAKLDFALIEGHFNSSQYGSQKYCTELFSGLCSVSHPFAGKIIPLQRVLQEHLLLREEGSGTRTIFEGFLYGQNCEPNDFSGITCVNNYGLLKSLLALNCGISFGYEVIARNNPEIAAFYLQNVQISHDFSYVYLKESGAETLVRQFDSYADRDNRLNRQ